MSNSSKTKPNLNTHTYMSQQALSMYSYMKILNTEQTWMDSQEMSGVF